MDQAKVFQLNESLKRIFNAGRVLSAENEGKIRAARDSLSEVLSKLEIEPDTDSAKAFNRASLAPGVLRVATDESTSSAEIFVYGDIGGWFDGVTAEDFAKELAALDVENITVNLNSGGGVVFDGIAIYNALSQHKATVVMNITGIAASIASVIAMAGDEIRIMEGAHFMIHKPWSFAIGDSASMRKEADILDRLESGIVDIYEARTGLDRAKLEAWVANETWFKGQEAVDAGFADEMVPAKKKPAAKSALLNLFKNAPNDLVSDNDTPEIREFERLLRTGEGFSKKQARRIAVLADRVRRTDAPTNRGNQLAEWCSEWQRLTKGICGLKQ
ncbi:MAG: Clp protease ClpP [Desulfobacteraceae bacterium]|nr:Clp protease ClpP [Desulfobacteraceae bacterium]